MDKKAILRSLQEMSVVDVLNDLSAHLSEGSSHNLIILRKRLDFVNEGVQALTTTIDPRSLTLELLSQRNFLAYEGLAGALTEACRMYGYVI